MLGAFLRMRQQFPLQRPLQSGAHAAQHPLLGAAAGLRTFNQLQIGAHGSQGLRHADLRRRTLQPVAPEPAPPEEPAPAPAPPPAPANDRGAMPW